MSQNESYLEEREVWAIDSLDRAEVPCRINCARTKRSVTQLSMLRCPSGRVVKVSRLGFHILLDS